MAKKLAKRYGCKLLHQALEVPTQGLPIAIILLVPMLWALGPQ